MTEEEFKKRYQYTPATDRLGEGGFGEVFKAYDTYRDRWVAIKVSKVRPDMESLRLKNEVEMVNRLPEHPNIAYYENCHTFSTFNGEYDFGILQYYEHGNLSQLLRQGSLSLEHKQNILLQILSGIDFLHSHGIIHRDLKPQNILMVKRNTEYVPKITDFGISKQLDLNKSSVFDNSIAGAGTLSYSSPEQLGDRTIRKNADLWSFGIIVYQTLMGSLPFTTGEHVVTSEAGRLELFRQINSGQLPEVINSIVMPWQQLIRACLILDPEKRVRNCKECIAILNGEIQENAKREDLKLENVQTRIDVLHGEIQKDVEKESLLTKEIYSESTRIESPKSALKPEPEPKTEAKPKPVKRILLGIAGGVAVLLLILFIINKLSTSSAEDFQTYKEAAFKNYENAQQGDTEFYDVALKYCKNALSIKKDEKLEDLKKEIELQRLKISD